MPFRLRCRGRLDQGDFTTVVNVLSTRSSWTPWKWKASYAHAGDACTKRGSPRASRIRESLERLPDNPGVLNNYAYYLAEADENLPRALELSTR